MMHRRFFYTNTIRGINRIGPHNVDVISVIVGSLLGGARANKRSGEGVRIHFKQSSTHKEYLLWLYSFFYSRGYTSPTSAPREYTKQFIPKSRPFSEVPQTARINQCETLRALEGTNEPPNKARQRVYTGFEFNTFTFRSFHWIYDLFYKKGTKRISPRIADYITPLALAVWIMDNGASFDAGVRISTNCLTLSEVQLLNDILKKKYKLDTTVQSILVSITKKERYYIYIKNSSLPKLVCIIFPYMHKSMRYKLGKPVSKKVVLTHTEYI